MSQLGTKSPTYKDGRTKQSFKDETDINKLLVRAQKTGTISHLTKYQGRYADFSNFDFIEAQLTLTRGREVFDALPVELRSEFNQSPAEFFDYVNNPANKERLDKLLPALAEPGRQNISIRPPSADETQAATEAATPAPDPEPKIEPEPAPTPPEAVSTADT